MVRDAEPVLSAIEGLLTMTQSAERLEGQSGLLRMTGLCILYVRISKKNPAALTRTGFKTSRSLKCFKSRSSGLPGGSKPEVVVADAIQVAVDADAHATIDDI